MKALCSPAGSVSRDRSKTGFRPRVACCPGLLLALVAGGALARDDVLPPGDRSPVLRVETHGLISRVNALAFRSDGRTLYAAGKDKAVWAWRWDEATERFLPDPEATFRIPLGPGSAGVIDALAVSPDDRWLAVGGVGVARHQAGFFDRGRYVAPLSALSDEMAADQGIIYVFDTESRAVRLLRGHRGPVAALTFVRAEAEGAAQLVSAAVELDEHKRRVGAVRVWDVEKGQPMGRLGDLPGTNVRPRISAWRAEADPERIRVAMAFNDKLADARQDVLRVWQWDGERGSLGICTNPLTDACVALPLRDRLLSGSLGEIQLWTIPSDVQTLDRAGSLAKTLSLPEDCWPGEIVPLCSRADGRFDYAAVAVCNLKPPTAPHLRIVRIEPWELLPFRIPLPDSRSMPALTAASQGEFLAATSTGHREIRVYRTADLLAGRAEPHQVLRGGGTTVRELSFVNKDGHLGLRLVPEDAELGGLVLDLSASRHSRDLAGWRTVPARPGRWEAALHAPGGRGPTRIAIVDPDGKRREITLSPFKRVTGHAICPRTDRLPTALLAVAYDDRGQQGIDLYDAEAGIRLRRLSAHTEPIVDLAFSADGRMLASTAEDRTVSLWWMADLRETLVGRHGWLHGLEVRSPEGKLTVAAVQPAAQPALREGLRPGDVIRDVVDASGKTHRFPHRTEFFEFFWNTKPGETIALRTADAGGPRSVAVRVEQAVDQRLPLCSLFLSHDAQRNAWSWIAWSPLGPYEASDRAVEKLLGWHFNTGDPAIPVRFAGVDQYREKFFGPGLLGRLIEEGGPPADWPPLATPQMSLILRNGRGEPIVPDDHQRAVVQDRRVEALLQLTGPPVERVGSVTCRLDGDAPLTMDLARDRQATWVADLSALDWRPGDHRLEATLRTREQRPREYTATQRVRFAGEAVPQPRPNARPENPPGDAAPATEAVPLPFRRPEGVSAPARIDILGLPEETTLTSRHFDLSFRVDSTRPLKRTDLRLQNRYRESFVFLPLPKPDGSGTLHFRHALELEEGTNELQVVVTDDTGNRAVAVRKLSVVTEPALASVDRVKSGPRVIVPSPGPRGGFAFAESAPEASVLICGRVFSPEARRAQQPVRQVVKAWVNGFLQSVTTLDPGAEADGAKPFQVEVVLNRANDNRIEIEFPGLPRQAGNRLEFDLDCRKPQTGQRLHLVMIGFGLSDEEKLMELARRALQIRDGRTPVFSEVRTYGPLVGRVRATQVKYQLELFRAATQNRFRDHLNDVLMVYYFGQEADADERFTLVTSENRLNPALDDESLITSDYLSGFLGRVHGAHLVLLDVGRPSSLARATHVPLADFPQLGILRSSWLETEMVPADRSLPVALEHAREAAPQATRLNELVGELAAVYTDPGLGYSRSARFNASVPPALGTLVLAPPR